MPSTRSLIFAAAFLALVVSGCSQTSIPTSQHADLAPQNFGTPAADGASGLAKHSSGVYVTGNTLGNLHSTQKGQGDAFIRKLDTGGKVIWGRQFGTPASDAASDIATDTAGNAYVLGRTSGNLARALRGSNDFFLRKYTASGRVAWTRQFGLETSDMLGGVAVSGSYVYVVGSSEGLGTFVYRFNAKTGGTYWKKRFDAPSQGAITADVSGNVYIAGTTSAACEYPDFQSDCDDVRLQKYNAAGNLVWSKKLNYAQTDQAVAITAHGSSVYLVVHTFDVPDDESYSQLVKLNASGVAQWSKFLGVASAYEEYISSRSDSVSADSSGVYAASTALTNFDDPFDSSHDRQAYAVAKFAPDGSFLWEVGSLDYDGGGDEPDRRIYGALSAVVARGSGDVYIAGTVGGGAGRSSDAFLKRLNAVTGRTVWNK